MSNRCIFSDKQVISPEDLDFGCEYMFHYAHNMTPIIVLSEPYQQETVWYLRLTFIRNGLTLVVPLSDLGIISYPDGNWNSSNYLEITP